MNGPEIFGCRCIAKETLDRLMEKGELNMST